MPTLPFLDSVWLVRMVLLVTGVPVCGQFILTVGDLYAADVLILL